MISLISSSPKNTNDMCRKKMLHVAGIKESKSLGMYLGVPLTGSSPTAKDYQHVIDKINKKLSL